MMQLIIPFLVYVIATFAIAFVWHMKLFAERYKALAIYRDDVLPQLGISSMVIQGICFALVYRALIDPMTGGWLAKAAGYGVFGAFLSWSFTTLAVAAKSRMASIRDYMAIETAFTIVQWIVVAVITAALA
jgi:hypothetical protein